MPTTMRILVPVDFGESSKAAVDYAIFFGERFGASLDILHVFEPSRVLGPPPALAAGQTVQEPERAGASQAMEGFLSGLERSPLVKTRSMIVAGRVVESILRIATLEKHDLVVMGSRGRTEMLELLEGGRSELVARLAPCPVVVVPG